MIDEVRLHEIWQRWTFTGLHGWKEDVTPDGWAVVVEAESGDVVCGIGDMEETEKIDHDRADFIAHAPDDIQYLLLLVKELRKGT